MNNFNFYFKRRLLTFAVLIAFVFAALLIRLFFVQVVMSADLQARALDQWTRDLELDAERGRVYDRNGVVLADNATAYTVYVRPNAVSDPKEVAGILSEELGADYQKLLGEIIAHKKSEITVAKNVGRYVMLDIMSHELDGVYFSSRNSRYYPYGDFLTQVVGFVNSDGSGQSGVELYYNKYLTGTDGYSLTETDLIGKLLGKGGTTYVPSVPGLDVKLTIDYKIQSIVESAVNEAFTAHNAKKVSAIVMNARTGEIAAMAQNPSYDLNDVPRDDLAALFETSKSSLISGVFEPGSTFKILTAAAAIEEGVVKSNQLFVCPGYRIVDGQRIKCWKTKGHGVQTFTEGIQNSCNCVFMDLVQALGVDKFYDYLQKFGIFEQTGIDLTGEASALSIARQNVKTVDLARIGFGQAIAMTPIELLNGINSAINGGKVMTPYLVSSINDRNGKIVLRNYSKIKNTSISEKTSALMRQYLEGVVKNGGGKAAGVPGYSIGGKTGTAQKYLNGAIAQGKYIGSFVGFYPAYNPEYIVMFIVDEPSGGAYYGSLVAAPYAGKIFAGIFNYLNIPANLSESDLADMAVFEMPDLRGMTYYDAEALLKRMGIYYEMDGEGDIVTYQIPAPGSKITLKYVIYMSTDPL
ncbi:MAG: PASTA domain-containing protein [Clostridiales bacterium]|jgi:stage V sporulation protein D (sporulation-specific penicillin-binding protein)|nr:PASTA domain-containing protein [Clostridiales bacterium]